MGNNKNTNRRDFIKMGSLLPIALPFLSVPLARTAHEDKQPLTCQDIADHFQKLGNWVRWERTTDTFKAGDPMKPVKKVAVAWKASLQAIETAIAQNADFLISHESICVNADNSSPEPEEIFALPSEKPKFELLKKSGLTVYRCHDFWDRYPGEGVRATWQRGLQLGGKIVADSYPYYVTETEPMTVRALARHVLKQTSPLKQDAVLVSGNAEKVVRRIGTGTGVNVDPDKLWDLGADVGIMTDDFYRHVRQGVHANEMDFPTIFVNHGVSEEWAIMNLAMYVQREFPSLAVQHIRQYCPYQIITNTTNP